MFIDFMKAPIQIIFLLCSLLGLASAMDANSQVSGPATVKLVSETTQVAPGQTFYLALDFELKPHWHIYWKNPGASGLPVEIDWELPEGFIAGEFQWPAPERIELGGLISYGFEDAVTLIVPILAPESLEPGIPLSIKAEASWLICKEVCLPGDASLALELTSGEGVFESEKAPLFNAARDRFPEKSVPWEIVAAVEDKALIFKIKQTDQQPLPGELYFYADTEGVIDPNAEQEFSFISEGMAELKAPIALEQLNQPLESFSGILQSADGSWLVKGSIYVANKVSAAPIVYMNTSEGLEGLLLKMGLPGWLILAFIGGLILNLMPCVLPVLSLKVFSLLKHSGQSRTRALLHGGAYTIGVVVSFLALAGLLLGLRAWGQQMGWGFQLQSPGFVAILTVFIFLFALNLMGVFEIGTSLVGADTGVSKRHDVFGSFGMGVLAAVVGAPCIGPYLASVSGIALQADVVTCLSIFGTVGFGLASPFLFLSIFPELATHLPKPGAWMETLKQFMGFLLMATALFLVYVAGTLAGTDAIIGLLSALLVTALAAWIYGRWSVPVKSKRTQRIAQIISFLLLLSAFVYAASEAKNAHQAFISDSSLVDEGSRARWSAKSVETALADGRPVFVDFTASWCLICQVNKKVALQTEATESLFEDYGIVALEADWTGYDPDITKELERFGRSGVPLYLLYAPDGQVTVLPQNLTNGKVREAIEKALD
ncbi:MAG: thiol:disulfide interchange protein DsbD [Lentimonas sp.]|jgi:thiol:disulfide interchange protein DsbD